MEVPEGEMPKVYRLHKCKCKAEISYHRTMNHSDYFGIAKMVSIIILY